MSLELVTGYQGVAHVTAEQDADLQRGIFGDCGILNVGNKMAVEILSANQITIRDGVLVADGREFHIPYGDSVDLDILSGSQSQKRYDIVVIQYTKDTGTGVESAEFVVITGTASTSPTDPDYTDNDIREGLFTSQKPFCRVRIDGLSIDGIDMLVDEIQTMPDMQTQLNDLKCVTVTVTSDSWVSKSGAYYATIDVSGMTADWIPGNPVLVASGTSSTDLAAQEAFACVSTIASGADTLTFTCYEDLPEADFTIRIPGLIE